MATNRVLVYDLDRYDMRPVSAKEIVNTYGCLKKRTLPLGGNILIVYRIGTQLPYDLHHPDPQR
jgi:hypothetical protein